MANIFDQLAKQLALHGYKKAGTVETEVEVHADVGRMDIAFTPEPFGDGTAALSLAPLGLFGRLASRPMVMEAFHNCPSSADIVRCIVKHQLYRASVRRKNKLAPPPTLWIISAGTPKKALDRLCFQPDPKMGRGIYRAPPALDTRLIAAGGLDQTRDTLIVRLYGAGAGLRQATKDLAALPRDSPEAELALALMVKLSKAIPMNPDERTPEEKEYTMDTFETLDSVMAEFERKGERHGRQALTSLFLKFYTRRFGPLPADLAPALDEPRDLAELERWVEIAANAPRDEILAALRGAK